MNVFIFKIVWIGMILGCILTTIKGVEAQSGLVVQTIRTSPGPTDLVFTNPPLGYVEIHLWSASGGGGSTNSGSTLYEMQPGTGVYILSNVTITGTSTLSIYVGSPGGVISCTTIPCLNQPQFTPGGLGYSNGGIGGYGGGNVRSTGSGGGGASAVLRDGTPVIIGGAGGGIAFGYSPGGSGGCQTGQDGVEATPEPANVVGRGAFGAAGGLGGPRTTSDICDFNGLNGASFGGLQSGYGGNGSITSCNNVYNGGGGGGGRAGGGGGATCFDSTCSFAGDIFGGSGAGGSSLYPSAAYCEFGLNDFTKNDKSVGRNDPYYDLAYSGSGGQPSSPVNFPGTPGQVIVVSDEDECDLLQPCQNGGTCVNTWASFYCICTEGFFGIICQNLRTACESQPCQNGATCISSSRSNFTCNCVSGTEGTLCQTNLDECVSQPCLHGGKFMHSINLRERFALASV